MMLFQLHVLHSVKLQSNNEELKRMWNEVVCRWTEGDHSNLQPG